jgi:hypothetical protein
MNEAFIARITSPNILSVYKTLLSRDAFSNMPVGIRSPHSEKVKKSEAKDTFIHHIMISALTRRKKERQNRAIASGVDPWDGSRNQTQYGV